MEVQVPVTRPADPSQELEVMRTGRLPGPTNLNAETREAFLEENVVAVATPWHVPSLSSRLKEAAGVVRRTTDDGTERSSRGTAASVVAALVRPETKDALLHVGRHG